MAADGQQCVVRMSVADPQKQGEGMSAFTSYKVTTELSKRLEGLDSLTYSVIRRFSDFVWLRSQLHDDFPCLMVPALPEKQALGRLNADFVDIRYRALQRFVERVCSHPELSTADATRKFISLQPDAFSALRDAKKSASALVSNAAVAAGSGVKRLVKSAAASISNAVGRGGGDAGAAPKSKSAEDLSFEELDSYLLNQAPLLTALYDGAAAVALRHREQAQGLLEYGAATRALAVTEGGPLGNALSQAGLAMWAGSTAAYEASVEESELWVERLADLVRGIRSVKELMSERARASAALADGLAVVERLRAHVTALASHATASSVADKGRAEAELVTAQAAVTAAREYYDRAAAAAIGEVDRYRVGLRGDLRGMLLDLVHTQVRIAAKLAAAWDAVAVSVGVAVAQEGATPLVPGALLAATAIAAASAATATATISSTTTTSAPATAVAVPPPAVAPAVAAPSAGGAGGASTYGGGAAAAAGLPTDGGYGGYGSGGYGSASASGGFTSVF